MGKEGLVMQAIVIFCTHQLIPRPHRHKDPSTLTQFKLINQPNTCAFGLWEKTHVYMGKARKLHTERSHDQSED